MRKTIVTIGWQTYVIDAKHVTDLLTIVEGLVAVDRPGYSGPYRPLLEQSSLIEHIQVVDYDDTPFDREAYRAEREAERLVAARANNA